MDLILGQLRIGLATRSLSKIFTNTTTVRLKRNTTLLLLKGTQSSKKDFAMKTFRLLWILYACMAIMELTCASKSIHRNSLLRLGLKGNQIKNLDLASTASM